MTSGNEGAIPYQEVVPTYKKRDFWLRLVSNKHAERYRAGNWPDAAKVAIAETVVTSDGRLAYIKNAKCGCTTITRILYRYNHGIDFDGDIHQGTSIFDLSRPR